MYKYCKTCGASVSNDAKFCQNCGGTDFISNNASSSQYTYDHTMYIQQPTQNQAWQPPVPQKQPKKTGLVIGIIAAIIVVLAGIGIIAEKALQDEEQEYGGLDYDFSIDEDILSDDYDSYEESEKKYYTKGTFDGSIYTNDWADIKFVLPEGFSDADLATYSAAENSNTECGMYFIADDTMSLIYISYEKLPTFPVYDEEEYLDAAMKSLQNVSGVTYKTPDTYTKATISGYDYTKAVCEFNNGNGDFCNTFYVRKLDKYMICIGAIGVTDESNDALVGNITTAK